MGDYGVDAGVTGTVVEHWDGVKWRIVPSPNAGLEQSSLFDRLNRPADHSRVSGGSARATLTRWLSCLSKRRALLMLLTTDDAISQQAVSRGDWLVER